MPGKRANSEGSVTKRKDGLWEARITLEGGKRKSFYAKTRQEASRKLAEALRDRDRGVLVVGGRQTVGQYLSAWLDTLVATIRPRTLQRYEQYVRVHLIPALGTITLTKLTAQRVQALYTRKLADGLSSSTVNHLHQVLHRALESAVRLELVQRNVCDLVDPPRMRHFEMTTLSEEQAHALLEAAIGNRFEALYVLALATGMRQGELLALRWRDVDLEARTLQVRATLQKDTLIFAEPKTPYSRRRIALSQTAVEALRRHHALQAEERRKMGSAWTDLGLVFPNTVGQPMDCINLLKHSFRPLLRAAGLPHMRFHDLRHTAATLLLGRGINPRIVSEMLGHSQIGITLGLYSHVTPHMQQQAADAMDAALDSYRESSKRSSQRQEDDLPTER
jgi:integrase